MKAVLSKRAASQYHARSATGFGAMCGVWASVESRLEFDPKMSRVCSRCAAAFRWQQKTQKAAAS